MNDNHDDLSKWFRYGPVVAPGVILLTGTNALMAAIEYSGFDHSTLDPARRLEITDAVGAALKPLEGGWCLHAEWQRRRIEGTLEQQGDLAVPNYLDDRRARTLEPQFRSRFYLVLTYQLTKETTHWLARLLRKDPTIQPASLQEALAYLGQYQQVVDEVASSFGHAVGSSRRLDEHDLATLIENCWSPEYRSRLTVPNSEDPEFPVRYMVPSWGYLPGLSPRLTNGGDREYHVRVIGIRGYPRNSHPGWLMALENLRFELRINFRFITLGDDEAKRVNKGLWRAHEDLAYDWRSIVGARLGFGPATRDPVGEYTAAEAGVARIEAETSGVRSGWLTVSIIVWGRTAEEADGYAAQVETALNEAHITPIREGVGTLHALLGSLPGDRENNLRQVPLTHVTLTDFMGLSSPYTGNRRIDHWDCDALVQLESAGGNPVFLNMHIGQDAAAFITGETRKGKSALMATVGMMTLARCAETRVICLDADEEKSASRVACWAAGGDYIAFDGKGLSLQPLAVLETDEDFRWAISFVVDLLERQGVFATAQYRTGAGRAELMGESRITDAVTAAIRALAERTDPQKGGNPAERRLSVLAGMIGYDDLRVGLAPYCTGGVYGALVDGNRDSFAETRWVTIDLMGLLKEGPKAYPVIRALVRRIFRLAKDGRPTLLQIDEAWRVLQQCPAEIDDLRRGLPKHNVALMMTTHMVEDIAACAASAILSTVKTFWAMGDSGAKERDLYETFGFTRAERAQIAAAEVGEVLVKVKSGRQSGSRFARLKLEPAALALCASNGDHEKLADEVHAKTGAGPAFAVEFLHRRGLSAEAYELEERLYDQWVRAAAE